MRVRLPKDMQAELAAKRIFNDVFLENVPKGRLCAFIHKTASLRRGELVVLDKTLREAEIKDGDENPA